LRKVGLIGPPNRPELERLAIRLEERGGGAVFIDSSRDPGIVVARERLRACGEDLASLAAIYVADLGLRAPGASDADGSADPEAGGAALGHSMRQLAAWNTLFHCFAGRGGLVVNPPAAQALHALKPHEVAWYRQSGIPAPRTLATTDAAALASLGTESVGGWIVKQLVGGYAHTERFEPPRTREAARRVLDGGPILVQEEIEGRNVRAFVVAGETIGAAAFIPLDGSEIDSRRGEARIQRVDLPEEAARYAERAAQQWGMTFAAIDFMHEETTGRYVVLECNSAPFFVAFEACTGVEVSGRLANHLLGIRRKR